MQLTRQAFYEPGELQAELEQTISKLKEAGEEIDYLTLVADGEPTLDANLGRTLEILRQTGYKTAVISNSSLLTEPGVAEELAKADWVSLKCDAVSEEVWRKINRPHGRLNLEDIKGAMKNFAGSFTGVLVTETMLIRDINDSKAEAGKKAKKEGRKIAEFLKEISPDISYVAVPTRPPAEERVRCPEADNINITFQLFCQAGLKTEYLLGYEGNRFSSTGDLERDLLQIAAVHPLKKEAVEELIRKCGVTWDQVDKMIQEEKIEEVKYQGEKFYLRK